MGIADYVRLLYSEERSILIYHEDWTEADAVQTYANAVQAR